jgi:prepilin-type N-terminal cleavage/methylation domain-containing protein
MARRLRQLRSRSRDPRQGFTLVEILVSITMLAIGMMLLGNIMARSARTADAASSVSYQVAILAAEANRLDAVPFSQLVAGAAVCDTTTALPLPRIRCVTITDVNAKRKLVKVKITPNGNVPLGADSVMFERSISGPVTPPLNTP